LERVWIGPDPVEVLEPREFWVSSRGRKSIGDCRYGSGKYDALSPCPETVVIASAASSSDSSMTGGYDDPLET